MATRKTTTTKTRAKATEKAKAPTFSKQALVNSKTFRHLQDALSVVLDDSKTYTIEEVNKILIEKGFIKKGGKQ